MKKEVVLIKNLSGLHMRPAGVFANTAQKFKSEVLFISKGNEYNAKSIINVLGAAVKCGDEIELQVNGEDEEKCIKEMMEIINNGLGE